MPLLIKERAKFKIEYLFLIILFFLISVQTDIISQSLGFNPDRGFYVNPISVTLETDLINSTIKYTTDSSWPSDTHGTVYTGPINITTTTLIKAVAYNATDTSKVKTHSYIFQSDVINQPAGLSIYPPDTGMDPAVVNDPLYSNDIIDGLNHIMTVSVSLPEEDFIDPVQGIYANPQDRGRDWERLASMEIIFPDGEHLQENMGIRIHGGASRNRDKKAFRIFFRDEYGPKKLDYPLFGETGDKSLDALVLRCRGGQSWVHMQDAHRQRGQMYRDQFARELQLEMGHNSPRGGQAHLYINGYYWGEYNLIEYPNQSYMSSYLGGEDEEYEIWNHSGKEEGIDSTWLSLLDYVEPGITTSAIYDSVASVVDLENLADYMLLNFFGGNNDWDQNNWYASKRNHSTGKWRFFAWDSEQFFKEITWDVTTKNLEGKPSRLFNRLIAYSDFKQLFMDKVHCHFSDDGILSTSFLDSLWMEGFATLGNSIIAESARWGDNQRPGQAYTLNNEFLNEQARLRNDYFPIRGDVVYQQLFASGFVDDLVEAVEYSMPSGPVTLGASLVLTNPNASGTIYYTIDGSDPRSPGGGVNSSALVYSAPIIINDVTQVRARVFLNGNWSPNCPQIYYPPQDYSGLMINEIHYNPNDSINGTDTISGRNFEFLELKNAGNSPINLTSLNFVKGLSFEFDYNMVIAPDSFIVLADDASWFEAKYGFAPDAVYSGKLDNGGENIWLADPFGNIVDSLRYNDNAPWPGTADKGYYSLALTDCALDNADGNNWGIQSVFTTPRAENYFTNFGVHPYSGIVINEIHYNPHDSIVPGTTDTINGRKFEFIELKNISSIPIDLSGSFLTIGIEYVFENGVIIQPGDFIVLAEDKSSFEDRYGFAPFDKYDKQLDNGGETIWLVNDRGVLLDAVTYDDVFPWDFNADGGSIDYSLALVDGDVDNDTYLNWTTQCNLIYTPGAENDLGCFTGLDYSGLTINEIDYAPAAGANHEFIELVNNSFLPIDLEGLRISNAVTYDFSGGQLLPGQYFLLARDSSLFENTYSISVDGDFIGGLNNSGETILLRDLFGNTIDNVSYKTFGAWTSEPLQGVKSLALMDANSDNSLGENWCVQNADRTPRSVNNFADSDNDGILDCLDPCPNFNNGLIGSACDDGDVCTIGELWDTNCNCTGGVFQDSDNDGVCDALDQCSGIDDSKIGTACDDGDPCTIGETFNSNCQCGGGVAEDTDNDGICDAIDQCPNFDNDLIGQPCDDGIICFVGSTWDANCFCTGGQYVDSDNDNVCDPLDACPGFDDNVDSNGNGIPDGCDECADYISETSNSIISLDRTANIEITTNGRVLIGDIDYRAGQGLNLVGGFEVKSGAVFHAYIASCN